MIGLIQRHPAVLAVASSVAVVVAVLVLLQLHGVIVLSATLLAVTSVVGIALSTTAAVAAQRRARPRLGP